MAPLVLRLVRARVTASALSSRPSARKGTHLVVVFDHLDGDNDGDDDEDGEDDEEADPALGASGACRLDGLLRLLETRDFRRPEVSCGCLGG